MKSFSLNSSLIIGMLIFLNSLSYGQCEEPLIVDLGNDTIICEGSSLILNAGPGVSYLWNDGSSDRTLTVTSAGIYSVAVTDECAHTDSDTIIVDLNSNPEFTLVYPIDDYFCKGDQIILSANVTSPLDNYTYDWSSGAITNESQIIVDTTGTYSVTITDAYGCTTTQEVSLEFQFPYEEEKVLLVTYDPTEGKNIVVWSRTSDKRTMEYELYNGIYAADRFAIINFNTTNLVIDTQTDPNNESRYYNLLTKDSCNNFSNFRDEEAHRSMLLTAGPNNDGDLQLNWNRYEGFNFDYYYIFRGNDPDLLLLIDSVANNLDETLTFVDTEATSGSQYYYQIKIKTPEPVYIYDPTAKKVGSGPFVHSLSNLEDYKSSDIYDEKSGTYHLEISPNPTNGEAIVKFYLPSDNQINIYLYNVLGERTACLYDEFLTSGIHKIRLNLNDICKSDGLYFLQLKIHNSISLTKKIIKN